jgi:myosin heavy subunit
LQQLRYSGVFEAVAIRKQGFPFRLVHEQWFKEYRALAPKACPDINAQPFRAACELLLAAIDRDVVPGLIAKGAYVGTTRVLYRANVHRQLTLYRNLALEKKIQVVQRYGR